MKKLILSLIVAVSVAGSVKAATYEEYKQALGKLKTLTLVSDTVFFFSAGHLIHALIPGPNCVTVPAAICTQTLAPVALPIIATYVSSLMSTASRVATLLAKAAKQVNTIDFDEIILS